MNHYAKIDTWHLPKVQSNATQQDYYPLITLCIPLLYYDVTSWHTDRTPTTVFVTSYNWEYINQQFNNFDMTQLQLAIKISALDAHWHSDSYTSCSVSYQTNPQTGAGRTNWQRWWMQVTCSLQQVVKGCLEVKVLCCNVLQMWHYWVVQVW